MLSFVCAGAGFGGRCGRHFYFLDNVCGGGFPSKGTKKNTRWVASDATFTACYVLLCLTILHSFFMTVFRYFLNCIN